MFASLLVATALTGHFGPHSDRVDNRWFPLRAGSVYHYVGVEGGRPSTETVRVAHAVKRIAGVRCAVVHDLLFVHGRVVERTTDWYAQDTAGTVWYFGENTAELDARGRVTSTEGTWRSGVRGARAGVFMPAHPRAGQAGQQEHFKGHAEDRFRVLRVGKRTLLTEETTPLEPGVVDHKLYRRGVGTVRERTVKGGDERNTLVSYRIGG
jgi:hypothetical protein